MREGLWNLYRDGVTQSMLQQYLTCREKFRLSYIEGLKYEKLGLTYAADYGTSVHNISEMLYTGFWTAENRNEFNPLAYVSKCIEFTAKEEEDDLRKRHLIGIDSVISDLKYRYDQIEATMRQYSTLYRKDFNGEKKWYALEQLFSVPIITRRGNVVMIKGKRDGEFLLKDEFLWLFETKTKGNFSDSDIVNLLKGDFQTLLYMWSMWKQYGKVPRGTLYNVIRRSQLRRKKTEEDYAFSARIVSDIIARPSFYFARYPASYSEQVIFDFEEQLTELISDLEDWVLGEARHFRNFKSCTGGSYACDFLDYCANGMKVNLKKRDGLFTELTPVRRIIP